MNKGVKHVRKSINDRKKTRGYRTIPRDMPTKKVFPALPQDEEKHGYYPSFLEQSEPYSRKNTLASGMVMKGMLASLLFFGVAILWQMDSDKLAPIKNWTSSSLTEEFPFAKVNSWYQETFGSPLAFSPNTEHVIADAEPFALPVSGNVTETFQTNGKGIMISPEASATVSALQEGIVVFSGNDRHTDKTVVIQHADGSKSTYGFLSSIDVHYFQFISANEVIGQFSPSDESETVYFAIEKDQKYIDPIQVINVNE